jgi:hypothetical protein
MPDAVPTRLVTDADIARRTREILAAAPAGWRDWVGSGESLEMAVPARVGRGID